MPDNRGEGDELYRNYNWRFDEVRRLENLIIAQKDEAVRDEFRKALVVLLYSHFEGFCIFAMEHYLGAINAAGMRSSQANHEIVAGSWEKLFNAMEHGDEKCRQFVSPLPHDVGLHRHWRRRHFLLESDRLLQLPVVIDEDIIDSESNLKPQVLQRNLFLLGLDHTFVLPHKDTINNLLTRRNNIAHGDQRRGVTPEEYNEFDTAVFQICYDLIDFLHDAHRFRRFEKMCPEFHI